MAVNENEVPRLHNLYKRALTNNVPDIRLIGPEELKQIEPHCEASANTFYLIRHMSIHVHV